MFGVTVVTEPAKEPLTLDDAKAHLRFYHDYEDDLIRSLITAARQYAEIYTGKAFITRELRLTRDCFPANDGCIRLPRPPLQTLTASQDWPDLGITYTNTSGNESTVSTSVYIVDATPEVGRICLAYGETWPTDAIDQPAAVKVRYLAGYGDSAADVPETIKAAMKLLIGHWFANREAVGSVGGVVAMAVQSLLGSAWSGQLTADFG